MKGDNTKFIKLNRVSEKMTEREDWFKMKGDSTEFKGPCRLRVNVIAHARKSMVHFYQVTTITPLKLTCQLREK